MAATLPITHLFIWEEYSLFNATLTHRIWITWTEIILISIAFLALQINIARDITNNTLLSTLLFTWVITGFIGTYFAENTYASIARQTELCIHILFTYTVIKALNHLPKSQYLIYGLLGAFLYSLIFILLFRIAIGDMEHNWLGNIPFFKHTRHWGYLLVIALPLSYYLILKKETSNLGFIIFTLIWASIIWSGGRGGFITAIVISFIVIPWLLKLKSSTFLKTLICICTALALALVAEVNHQGLSIRHLFFISPNNIEGFNLNQYSSGRIDIFLNSLTHIFNNNYIFGSGADAFRYTTPPLHPTATHPHNLPIQLFYSHGIIGVILISAISWILTKKAKKNQCLENKIASIALLGAVILSLIDGIFYQSYSLFCLTIIFSIYLHNTTGIEVVAYSKRQTAYQFLLFLPLIVIWVLHTKTYLEFQKPLSSSNQISNVKLFPSIILKKSWLKNSKNEELSIATLMLGGEYSDSQCSSFLTLEFLYKLDTKKQILDHCPPSILSRREKSNYE